MDHAALSSNSVLETLQKTNRPATDQEKAIILESMAPTNAKLKVVEAQISDTMAHIQALKSQVEQAEIKLQRLREEEAAILETFAEHRRVLSPLRNLPEDVLRDIFVTYVEAEMPTLSSRREIIPSPYILAQICSRMRHIALTTPIIWASMNVAIYPFYFNSLGEYEQAYSILARKASEWFERAGNLALTVFIQDHSFTYAHERFESTEYDPSSVLFDILLSYSTRWKELQFDSYWSDHILPTSVTRIAALTPVDLPLLQSVSLCLDGMIQDSGLHNSALLTISTLKHVKFETHTIKGMFSVNWAVLTSFTLSGNSHGHCRSISEITRTLGQTKCLVFCEIVMRSDRSEEHNYPNNIYLSCLKSLIVHDSSSKTAGSSGVPNILDLITAPILEKFTIFGKFFKLSLLDFFKRSPGILNLSLRYSKKDKLLMDTIGFLRHCPSLTALSLMPRDCGADIRDGNMFLQAFVEEGDAGVICPRPIRACSILISGEISTSLSKRCAYFLRASKEILLR